eukprot:1039643-Ditylum_brightwellii.AAC.2
MIGSFPLCAYVSMKCWQPSDFASDHLVLQVICCETILKMSPAEIPFGSTFTGNKEAVGLTLFFMCLHPYAVDGKGVPAAH